MASRLFDHLFYLGEKDDASIVEVSVGGDRTERGLSGRAVGIEFLLVIANIFVDPSVETLDVCLFLVNSL